MMLVLFSKEALVANHHASVLYLLILFHGGTFIKLFYFIYNKFIFLKRILFTISGVKRFEVINQNSHRN